MLYAPCLDVVDEGVESVREGGAADDIPSLFFGCFCCGAAAGAAFLSGVEMTFFTTVAGAMGVREFFGSGKLAGRAVIFEEADKEGHWVCVGFEVAGASTVAFVARSVQPCRGVTTFVGHFGGLPGFRIGLAGVVRELKSFSLSQVWRFLNSLLLRLLTIASRTFV
ncbi:unnamed protein product [Echinostoma caproni]|uniref:Uncharacterized protein n=1 Tax=Echinostoma caproni TaxID=27848 RepID=A0A183A792_9TREM|nr:unnamed protein product [Echinostoma caproni]